MAAVAQGALNQVSDSASVVSSTGMAFKRMGVLGPASVGAISEDEIDRADENHIQEQARQMIDGLLSSRSSALHPLRCSHRFEGSSSCLGPSCFLLPSASPAAQRWVAIALAAAITVASGMGRDGASGVAGGGPTASVPVGARAPSDTFGFADKATGAFRWDPPA